MREHKAQNDTRVGSHQVIKQIIIPCCLLLLIIKRHLLNFWVKGSNSGKFGQIVHFLFLRENRPLEALDDHQTPPWQQEGSFHKSFIYFGTYIHMHIQSRLALAVIGSVTVKANTPTPEGAILGERLPFFLDNILQLSQQWWQVKVNDRAGEFRGIRVTWLSFISFDLLSLLWFHLKLKCVWRRAAHREEGAYGEWTQIRAASLALVKTSHSCLFFLFLFHLFAPLLTMCCQKKKNLRSWPFPSIFDSILAPPPH